MKNGLISDQTLSIVMARDTMINWLIAYEKTRTDPYTTAKERLSSRFDLSGLSWNEIREIPIPELVNPETGECLTWGTTFESLRKSWMTFGTSFEALRKSWYSYKRYKKDDFSSPDLALRILKLQKILGLPLSSFEELDNIDLDVELNNEIFSGEEVSEEQLLEWC